MGNLCEHRQISANCDRCAVISLVKMNAALHKRIADATINAMPALLACADALNRISDKLNVDDHDINEAHAIAREALAIARESIANAREAIANLEKGTL